MVQGFLGLRNQDPGFNADRLLTTPITLPVEGARERLDLFTEVATEAGAVPGVVGVTLGTALPLNAFATGDAFDVVGRPVPKGQSRPRAFWSAVATDYTSALEIDQIRGRFFTSIDGADGPRVAVVNETLVRNHLAGLDPIGQRLRFRDAEWEIVGVVEDTRQSLIGTDIANPTADPVIFLPLAQTGPGSAYLFVRTAGEPLAVTTPLRLRLEAVHSRLVAGPMQTLDELVDQVFVGIDVMTEVLRGFGYLALLLAAIGTYGVLAYNVAQRGQEIGVRLAVGARQEQVVRMIVRQGTSLGVIGLLIGAPVVWALVRVLDFALRGLGEVQFASVFVVAGVLLVTTVLASLLPALRAARMHPVDVLRHE